MAVLRTPWTALAFRAGRSAGGLSAFAQAISALDRLAALRDGLCRRQPVGARHAAAVPVAGAVCHASAAGLADRRIGGGTGRRPHVPTQRARSRLRRVGWWFGFGYFIFGLFWIGEAFLVEAEKFAVAHSLRRNPSAGGAGTVHGARHRRRAGSWRPGLAASSSWRSRSRWRNGCAATSSRVSRGTRSATRSPRRSP